MLWSGLRIDFEHAWGRGTLPLNDDPEGETQGRGTESRSTARRWTGGRRWRCGTTDGDRRGWGYGGSGPAQLALVILLTDASAAERLHQRNGASSRPIEAGSLGAGRWTDDVVRPGGGGELSTRRLLGAHLPAASPERRETVAGGCLGCLTQFAIDVRLPLPTTCPDCGADVLASADIKGEAQPRLPFDPLRIRRTER